MRVSSREERKKKYVLGTRGESNSKDERGKLAGE